MKKLKFYIVNNDYVKYLQKSELDKRGFTRVPNNDYEKNSRKPKFFCGVVLSVDGKDYYVPVSSYKTQKPDNFLIYSDNGEATSSLRFNYMFPIPKESVVVRNIPNERNEAYKRLLLQELEYCVNNQSVIHKLAERTYNRVLLGKDLGLVANACDFKFLEEMCVEYCRKNNLKIPQSLARQPLPPPQK
ncbi:MAG: type III toxin-antitoxin system ToxN/AbiQ family toxin [Oscillospiraceae bacterium]|nr:type III toxin-antitoxin system ToxN/AbiQ family toxin [Oscillospiraceae bacterium]